MHPYVIDRMVQERRDELARLAQATRHSRPPGARARRGAWFGAMGARMGRRADPTPRIDPCPQPQVRPW